MATSNDNFRSPDIEFLFECLGYAANPLVINVAAMGTAKHAKPNTLQKRLTTVARRYNLNISSTTKGDTAGSITPVKSNSTNAKAKTPGTGAGGRKRKAAVKVENTSEESEEESGPRSKKQKANDGDAGSGADVNGEIDGEESDGEGDDDADELA